MKDKFKIGELSKLFDICVDSIRYYEKVGILHPVRDEDNNYRMYTVDDVRRLVLIRELLGLNFSTERIRSYDEDRNVKNTVQLLQEELDTVNAQIAKLGDIKSNIQSRLDTIGRLSSLSSLETVVSMEMPARHCIMVTDDHLPDDYVSYYVVKYMQQHKIKIDTIGACDCYTLDIPGSNPDSMYYRTKNVFFHASYLDESECNYTLPAGTYLSLTYRGPLAKTRELMPSLYEYANARHLAVTGDPIEMCHIDEFETNDTSEYIVELELPVLQA